MWNKVLLLYMFMFLMVGYNFGELSELLLASSSWAGKGIREVGISFICKHGLVDSCTLVLHSLQMLMLLANFY